MKVIIFLIFLSFSSIQSQLTIPQYSQLELENPENLLQANLEDHPHSQHPNIPKLMFLTPWNKKGHQLSIKYARKLDYVSPCWYSLIVSSKGQPIFENQHNYDEHFATQIKKANPNIKLIPRIYIDGNHMNVFQSIGTSQKNFHLAIDLIARVLQEKQFDGIIWDSPYNFFQKSRSSLNGFIVEFIKVLRMKLTKNKIIFFNMGNPKDHMNSLETEKYGSLEVDAILIQNYDKGDKFIEIIQKSISWANNLNRKDLKIIMMLPFFSVKVGVGSLSTQEAISSLKRNGVAAAEVKNHFCHFIEKRSKRQFLIPCYSYFKKAFELIEENGFEAGFWEGGNGIQNYYKFF